MNLNTSLDLAVAAPSIGHHISVAPGVSSSTPVAPLSWSNYLGGATILVLLLAMIGSGLNAAGLLHKEPRVDRRRFKPSTRSVHNH